MIKAALVNEIMTLRDRKANQHRNWAKVVALIDNKYDSLFQKSYILTRKVFHDVLEKISLLKLSKEIARSSL
jgi:hypothetical protein